jgi:hypothetical protein
MPTFQRTETVDARKFTGGGENGPELIFWVNSKEGKAIWVSDQTFNRGGRDPEHIRLYDNPYSHMHEVAYPGDWIMQHQDGHFAVVRQQELDSEYKEV